MILLIENDEDDVFLMRRVLQKLAWNELMYVSPDGRDALNYLQGAGDYANRQSHPLPSVIFLDLKLPRVHGFDVLDWISQQPSLSKIPVVVLSASPHIDDRTRARDLKAKFYLVKPPDAEKIRAVFQTIFGLG